MSKPRTPERKWVVGAITVLTLVKMNRRHTDTVPTATVCNMPCGGPIFIGDTVS